MQMGRQDGYLQNNQDGDQSRPGRRLAHPLSLRSGD